MSIHVPMVTSPQRYTLPTPGYSWGWCKLTEVMEAATNLAKAKNFVYRPITQPLDFVLRFCLLSNIQSVSEGKFFYSNGETLEYYTHKELDIINKSSTHLQKPSPDFWNGLYVPEGWVKAVLKVVEKGGNRVMGGTLMTPGYPSSPSVLLCTGEGDIVFFVGAST